MPAAASSTRPVRPISPARQPPTPLSMPPLVSHPPQEYLLRRLPSDPDLRRRFLWGWDAFQEWARARGLDMVTQLRVRLSAVGVGARAPAVAVVG